MVTIFNGSPRQSAHSVFGNRHIAFSRRGFGSALPISAPPAATCHFRTVPLQIRTAPLQIRTTSAKSAPNPHQPGRPHTNEISWKVPYFAVWSMKMNVLTSNFVHVFPWQVYPVSLNKSVPSLRNKFDSTVEPLAGIGHHGLVQNGHGLSDLGLEGCFGVVRVFVYLFLNTPPPMSR